MIKQNTRSTGTQKLGGGHRRSNSGDRAGSEVVQCYVAPEASVLARPPKELKGFA